MKAREDRHKVLIPARLRWRGSWEPASIRDISRAGLMMRITHPPSPGTYVEIELANRRLAARTVWADGQSCGFKAQDILDVAGIRGGKLQDPAKPAFAATAAPLRRRAPSAEETAERSRQFAAVFQFVTLVAVVVGAAFLLASEVYHVLAAPMNAIGSHL